MTTMRVKPTTEGAVIRDPKTRVILPAEGGTVPRSPFWRRRLAQGDVELVKEAAKEPPTGREQVTPLTTRGRLAMPDPAGRGEGDDR